MLDKLIKTLTNEFQVDSSVAISNTIKAIPIKDVFTITLKYIDKEGETISSVSIRFVKNQIPKAQHKLFKEASYKEVENQFLYAKDEIIQKQINQRLEQMNILNAEIEQFKSLTHTFMPSIEIPGVPTEVAVSKPAKQTNSLKDKM